MDLTPRELATVLAALRYWQRSLTEGATPPITEHFADATPLDAGAIDDLCERLNTQPENRLAFGADHPLTIKHFLRWGEFEPKAIQTVQDLYDQAGGLLDRVGSWDICGECVFEGEDGKFYVGSVEFHVDAADPDYLQDVLQELESDD